MKRTRGAETCGDMYSNNVKLLQARAIKFSTITGIPFEEMRSEANVAFMKAAHAYDKTKGNKFITPLYVVVDNHLKTFTKLWTKQLKANHTEDGEMPDIPCDNNLAWRVVELQRKLKTLSLEAQGVAHVALSCSDELANYMRVNGYRTLKTALCGYLKGLSWEDKKINKAFEELERAMKEI